MGAPLSVLLRVTVPVAVPPFLADGGRCNAQRQCFTVGHIDRSRARLITTDVAVIVTR